MMMSFPYGLVGWLVEVLYSRPVFNSEGHTPEIDNICYWVSTKMV